MLLGLAMSDVQAQQKADAAWPFSAAKATPGAPSGAVSGGTGAPGQAPKEVRIIEKKLDQLTPVAPSAEGEQALAIKPEKWRHAETDHFILHYRRLTEAQKVAREVEFSLWYVASALGAGKDRYSRKSHIYIFEDEAEWTEFKKVSGILPWSASVAKGDELFLNVRDKGGSGGSFDSQTLAHEATHAVVARIFPGRRWPLWLNEGFAEYMGGVSTAARKGQGGRKYQTALRMADMTPEALEALTAYPSDEEQISRLYQSSEKLVRFLMNEFPKDRFVKFIDSILAGQTLKQSIAANYADKVKDWDSFNRKYEKFVR